MFLTQKPSITASVELAGVIYSLMAEGSLGLTRGLLNVPTLKTLRGFTMMGRMHKLRKTCDCQEICTVCFLY